MKPTSLRSRERALTVPILTLRYITYPPSIKRAAAYLDRCFANLQWKPFPKESGEGKRPPLLHSAKALPRIPMPIIELAQHRHPIGPTGHQDHHMHDLMASPKDIKAPRMPPLRKLHPPQSANNPRAHRHRKSHSPWPHTPPHPWYLAPASPRSTAARSALPAPPTRT
jgi:hypothetical protein